MEIFRGSCTAIVTPFSQSGKSINYKTFKKLIDFQIENGTSAIVFMGTTGEASTMTKKEKEKVAKFAVEYINKRVPVIIGAGSNNTKDAISNSQIFEKLGADALLHVTPYYNKATQNGLIKHYTEIAKSVKIPIILYNVPSRTGVNILPDTVKKLSQIENIVAIKEASGNFEQIVEILKITDKNFSVYSGDDANIFLVLALGGKGVISVVSNLLPQETANICKTFFEGNIEKSRQIQFDLMPIIKALFGEVNPIPIKTALKLKGFKVGIPRLPLTEMEKKNVKNLKKILKKY
ncbi:MAG: 4-hydroxy-tetrahydrodipicolinate synthase [Clostridia bacterium]|nr:4-hydroxy-tetrahydrodipicolinate synthase [Clostridia bacterium]